MRGGTLIGLASEITEDLIGLATASIPKQFEGEDIPEQSTDVSSSAIARIGYKDGAISITFNRGGTYVYAGDYELYRAFVVAPSKGRFFNAHFK